MSADMYAWEPSIGLDPHSSDFNSRIENYSIGANRTEPSEAMKTFVASLLKRYPDLTGSTDGTKTAWADGPLLHDANGGFIHLTIQFDRFSEAQPFFINSANDLGLNAYDPQDGRYYPAQKGTPFAAWIFLGIVTCIAIFGARHVLSRRDITVGWMSKIIGRK